jgi:hypothetical protein
MKQKKLLTLKDLKRLESDIIIDEYKIFSKM